jgi:hypothetical protein
MQEFLKPTVILGRFDLAIRNDRFTLSDSKIGGFPCGSHLIFGKWFR